MILQLQIFILSLLAIIGDMCMKNAAGKLNTSYTIIGFGIYNLSILGWLYVFNNYDVSKIGIFYSIFTLLILVGIGVLYYKEHLTVREWIGFGLACIAIILLKDKS
jgi:multidrug transporter EmrE-like cation transporter